MIPLFVFLDVDYLDDSESSLFIEMVPTLFGHLFNFVYTTFFLWKFQATPGKMALGIKVITADGDQLSFLRCVGRYFGEIISGMILYIGYIIAAFDPEKRALHDHMCATRVVKK